MKIAELLPDTLQYFDLKPEEQNKLIQKNPTVINKIKNLDPGLAEKYKNTKKAADAGFF